MTKTSDYDLTTAMIKAGREAPTASRWSHAKTGKQYMVLAVAHDTTTMDVVVVYRRIDKSALTWTRPIAEFLDGRFERMSR